MTDTGLKRSVNEDAYWLGEYVIPSKDHEDKTVMLAVLADGMGGARAGEVASRIAVDTVVNELSQLEQLPEVNKIQHFLQDLINNAHHHIANEAMTDSDKSGLGTTILVLLIIDNQAHITWVGDSRAYLYDGSDKEYKYTNVKGLKVLTRDHSLVWDKIENNLVSLDEAEHLDNNHIITKSLGSYHNNPRPDYKVIALQGGETFLLCTDGVNRHLKSNEISEICQGKINLDQAGAKIYDHGAEDNFTIALIQVEGAYAKQRSSISILFKRNIKELIFGVLLAFGAIWAISQYADDNSNKQVGESQIVASNDKKSPSKVIKATTDLKEINTLYYNVSIMLEKINSLDTSVIQINQLKDKMIAFQNQKPITLGAIQNGEVNSTIMLDRTRAAYDLLQQEFNNLQDEI